MSESENTTGFQDKNRVERDQGKIVDGVNVAAPQVIYPFADMPGSGRLESEAAGKYGMWGYLLIGIGGAIMLFGLGQALGSVEYAELGFLYLVVVVSGFAVLVGIVLLAVSQSLWRKHASNAYLLQVAVARSLNQLEGFDVSGINTESVLVRAEEQIQDK